MSGIGANNAVEIITFLVLAVLWAAVQILNRGARKPRPAPRATGQTKPERPPKAPEDELRRFFEQLARAKEEEAASTPEPSPAPSAARPPPTSRTYSAPPAHPPPIPVHPDPPAPRPPDPQRARPLAPPSFASVAAPDSRTSRKRAPIPFPRVAPTVSPRSINVFDPAESAAVSSSIRRRVQTGLALRSVAIPLRTSMPPLPSQHLRTTPAGTSASHSPAAALFRTGRRSTLRKAVILSAILGPSRALAPTGRDLPYGD